LDRAFSFLKRSGGDNVASGRLDEREQVMHTLSGRIIQANKPYNTSGADIMSQSAEELTIAYEEDGVEVIRELDKAILGKGAWVTVVFRYQQWEPAKEAYSDDKYSVRRYRKMKGEYRAQSKFNISGKEQAKQLIEVLGRWIEE
jgi:hypothetical protein